MCPFLSGAGFSVCLLVFFFDFARELFMALPVVCQTVRWAECPASPVAFREEAAVRVLSVECAGGRHQAWIGVVTRVM